MAEDLVNRLRLFSLDDGTDALNKLLAEAANSIELWEDQFNQLWGHDSRLLKQRADLFEQVERLRAERDRWTQCAERLVEWQNQEAFIYALEFYKENQRLDMEAVRGEQG